MANTTASIESNVSTDDDDEANLTLEIRRMITESEADCFDEGPITNSPAQVRKKTVNAVISSPGYITAMKQKQDEKDAAAQKKQENRLNRLEKEKQKIEKAAETIKKLQTQIDSNQTSKRNYKIT